MCGIVGMAGLLVEDHQSRFREATELLAHRGPDANGQFASSGVLLGHRRLSIIDPGPGGAQPMEDQRSGTVVVFNGMIYNYRELRTLLETRGHCFRSECDTEVLLRAFLEWGPHCLQRLNGMWAFALWCPRRAALFLARDRFGVKPLFIRRGAKDLSFASEAKALTHLHPDSAVVDETTLAHFLTTGVRHAGNRSFFRGIEVFPPAHYAWYRPSDRRWTCVRYWDYPEVAEQGRVRDGDAFEEFEALLVDAVRIRLRSDQPLGVTLSGGLDSTAVLTSAYSAGECGPPVCFTSTYGTHSGEEEWASKAAARVGLQPIEVAATRDGWVETLSRITWNMDGPCAAPAVYPVWRIMEAARARNVLVLLEGQGADELLGGYTQHAALHSLHLLRGLLSRPTRTGLAHAATSLRGLRKTYPDRFLPLMLAKEAIPALRNINHRWLTAGSTLRRDVRLQVEGRDGGNHRWRGGGDPMTEQLRRDHASDILPGLLDYGDAMSMAHGVETRQPFMDYRLVEWGFSKGPAAKIRAGETKWLLRRYLRREGQEEIAARYEKLGYPTPAEEWLLADDAELLRDRVLSEGSRISEYCDIGRMERLVDLARRGLQPVRKSLYRLLVVELWLETTSSHRG